MNTINFNQENQPLETLTTIQKEQLRPYLNEEGIIKRAHFVGDTLMYVETNEEI